MKNRHAEGLPGRRGIAHPSKPNIEQPVEAMVVGPAGLWRDGDLLVAMKETVFPDRCPITNEPATTRYPYEVDYFSPAAKFALAGVNLFVPIVGGAMAYSMARSAESGFIAAPIIYFFAKWISRFLADVARFDIAFADEYVHRSRIQVALAAAVFVGGAGLAYIGFALLPLEITIRVIFGISMGLFSLWSCGQILKMRRELAVVTMSPTHVWLRGAHADFLADLPYSSFIRPAE